MNKDDQRKTVTDPDSQAHVLGAGEPVTGLRILDTNTEFTLPNKERVTIGADESCDITVPNSTVSSVHCVLEWRDRGWLLVDQNSKNGTRRGRHPCKEFPVEDGEWFLLGTLAFVPFSGKSQRVRMKLQRFVGYADSFQFQVERFLRAIRSPQHLLLVGDRGSRRAELARLVHDARDTTGPFVELSRPVETGGEQIALLKDAQDGTLFVHQQMLPHDRQALLHSLSPYRVRLIGATYDKSSAPAAWGTLYNELQLLRVASLPDRRAELPQILQATLDAFGSPGKPASISPRNLRAIEQYEWPSMEELLKSMTCATALAKHRSQRAAAKALGIPRSTLQRRMERYGLK